MKKQKTKTKTFLSCLIGNAVYKNKICYEKLIPKLNIIKMYLL